MSNEMTQEQMIQIIANDKKQREEEFMQALQELAERLRVSCFAEIVSQGQVATARIVAKAE